MRQCPGSRPHDTQNSTLLHAEPNIQYACCLISREVQPRQARTAKIQLNTASGDRINTARHQRHLYSLTVQASKAAPLFVADVQQEGTQYTIPLLPSISSCPLPFQFAVLSGTFTLVITSITVLAGYAECADRRFYSEGEADRCITGAIDRNLRPRHPSDQTTPLQ